MIRLQIRKGLNVDLGSVPREPVRVDPDTVALLGGDYPGVRPHLEVEVGTQVHKGETLFIDRARPRVRFTAPADGRVRAIHRGARRSLESIVLDVDGDGTERAGTVSTSDESGLRATLLDAGLWPAFRTRPHDRIPDPDAEVREIYVTAVDTHPLAPDPATYIAAHGGAFCAGLELLARLAEVTYLCMAAGSELPRPEAPGITPVEVSGPHPAGLAGTHIYEVARAEGRQPIPGVWHVGYQDVIAIGYLFRDGRLFTQRWVTAAGPGVQDPRTITTTLGAELGALTGPVEPGAPIISGPVFSGRAATRTTSHLSRYHNQVVVMPPSDQAAGSPRGMLPLEAFERLWPFRVPVLPLLRALLIEDTETVSALGCTLLAEEDMGLCSYICPSRLDYGAALERTLAEIRRGG
jgi:Na+-transporting NADH:ubiquinone oxidoreductase subunit A